MDLESPCKTLLTRGLAGAPHILSQISMNIKKKTTVNRRALHLERHNRTRTKNSDARPLRWKRAQSPTSDYCAGVSQGSSRATLGQAKVAEWLVVAMAYAWCSRQRGIVHICDDSPII